MPHPRMAFCLMGVWRCLVTAMWAQYSHCLLFGQHGSFYCYRVDCMYAIDNSKSACGNASSRQELSIGPRSLRSKDQSNSIPQHNSTLMFLGCHVAHKAFLWTTSTAKIQKEPMQKYLHNPAILRSIWFSEESWGLLSQCRQSRQDHLSSEMSCLLCLSSSCPYSSSLQAKEVHAW